MGGEDDDFERTMALCVWAVAKDWAEEEAPAK